MDSLVALPCSPGRLRSAFPHPGRGAASVVPRPGAAASAGGAIRAGAQRQQYPVSYEGILTIDESVYKGKNTANSSFPPDTHIDLSATTASKGRTFGKGIVAVNGHVLGRYW